MDVAMDTALLLVSSVLRVPTTPTAFPGLLPSALHSLAPGVLVL